MNMDTMNLIMDGCAVLFVIATFYYLFRWLRIMALVMKKAVVMGEIVHVKLGKKNKREQFEVEYGYRTPDGKAYSKIFRTSQPEEGHLGDPVKVYYDPKNPAKSYCSAEEKTERKIMLFCVITMAIVGVMQLFS